MTELRTERPIRTMLAPVETMPFDQLRDTLDLLSVAGIAGGYETAVVIDSDDLWLGTWANEDSDVAVRVKAAGSIGERPSVDLYAAVAHGCEWTTALSQALWLATWRFDEGEPRIFPMTGGTAAVGWGAELAAEQLTDTTFVGAAQHLIDSLAAAASSLATELVPTYGGRHCRESDGEGWATLLRGALDLY